ncbi:MAG TPA: peptidylprolyl isomerase [Candidatus Saccharimonas sp.]|nr:peptidylprolyl isomerase [Candidatus Saccharimonas sp.]
MPKKKEELEPVQPETTQPEPEPTEAAEVTDKPEPKEPKPAKSETKIGAKPEVAVAEFKAKREWHMSKDMAIKIGAGVAILLALALLAFGVLIYVYKSESAVVRMVSEVVPYPVEEVNGGFVRYSEYLFDVDANKRAYQNNAKLNNQPAVDFNSADGKKMLSDIRQHSLEKLKADEVTAQLAHQKKVTVSDKEVNDLVNDLYNRYGGKETLLKTLKQIYNWDLSDLRSVVRKQLLAQKLQDKVTSDPAVAAQAKAKAQDVLNKIQQGGDFAALAKQYSQASDASSGGDLGSFTKGQLPDELQKAVDALQPGQVSDLVQTKYGFEIIKVTAKNGDSAQASHILIETIDYDQYFQDQLNKAKTKYLIKV